MIQKSSAVPVASLLEVARCHGTPTYAYDLDRMRAQVARIQEHIPRDVDLYYALKANASLAICGVFADLGLGAGVTSAGEVATAVAAEVPPERLVVGGPHKSAEVITWLASTPGAVISVDSPAELQQLGRTSLANRAVLRMRPDYPSTATASGLESRFGIPLDELRRCRSHMGVRGMEVMGFHVFSGHQLLDTDETIGQLRSAVGLVQRASDSLGVDPRRVHLGGGFGVPGLGDGDELDLARIGGELETLMGEVPGRFSLELGRYLVAESGWYLTRVVGYQTQRGRPAVIVDGGTHQISDGYGLGATRAELPLVPLLGRDVPQHASGTVAPTDVLGCLGLPGDVLGSARLLPPLSPGDVLAFPCAGAYGYWSSPLAFQGSTNPAEVAFTRNSMEIMRPRGEATSILVGQNRPRLRSPGRTSRLGDSTASPDRS